MIETAEPKDFRWGIGCAVCGPGTECTGEPLLLSRGITIWLCQEHRSTRYLTAKGGTVFVDTMTTVWNASCGMSIRRQEALAAHIRWVRDIRDRERLPTFMEPWIGSRPNRPKKRRPVRRTGLVAKPQHIKPISLPRPTPGTAAPPADARSVPVRKPPPTPGRGGQARPDDQPP
jgi:hypothetical protein